MSRSLKKSIYGAFYVLVLVLVVFIVYQSKLKPEQTCFDNIKNQNEEDVDCGGLCVQRCDILRLKPPTQEGAVRIFPLASGQVILLAEIKNPNTDYGISQFSYIFNIYGDEYIILETIKGTTSLYPGEKKYLYTPDATKTIDIILDARIEFSGIEWKRASEYVKPAVSAPQNVTTEIDDARARVSGNIYNQSALMLKNVNIVAILADKFDNELLAAQTFIDRLDGFSKKEFLVLFPRDETVMARVDKEKTKVFISFE